MNNQNIDAIFSKQLQIGKKLVTISHDEDQLLKDIPSKLSPIIISTCKKFSYPIVDIIPVGSSQRQTYLPGNRDIDIFVRLDTRDRLLLEKFASEIIPQLAQSLHTKFEIKYAENPYGVIHYPLPHSNNFISVDIVVTIWIENESQLSRILPISGMARTPFHMFYLQTHIQGLEEEIRLFKYWSKQKKLYRQAGFTGFISELLIIIYKSFKTVLTKSDEISSLIYDFHGRSLNDLRKKFSPFPIVLIDPIDMNRNAAAGIHGILGALHLQRLVKLSQESLKNPDTLWQEYELTGNVFTLKIEFVKGLDIKNDEEYYSRIVKILGLVYRALQEQQIIIQDAIINIKQSTLSFTTDSVGGDTITIKGPPAHLIEHVKKFIESNHDSWIEEGFYYTRKYKLPVQEIVLKKIINPEIVHSISFL